MPDIKGLKFTQKGIAYMGGEGSGHHGHAGRPGSVGGSVAGGGGPTPATQADKVWADSLTEDERAAVDGYLHIGEWWRGSAHINSVLREGKELNERDTRSVKDLDSAIAKGPKTTESTAFYRGMPPDKKVADGSYVSAMKQGSEVGVYGETRFRKVIKFIVPAGTPVVSPSSLYLPISEEVLLPRNVVVLSQEVWIP